jgi:hypothetical protein
VERDPFPSLTKAMESQGQHALTMFLLGGAIFLACVPLAEAPSINSEMPFWVGGVVLPFVAFALTTPLMRSPLSRRATAAGMLCVGLLWWRHGAWFGRHIGRVDSFSTLAWFLPSALVLIGLLVYLAVALKIGPGRLRLCSAGALAAYTIGCAAHRF